MLDKLPLEIQLRILSYLDQEFLGNQMQFVNEHFRRLSMDPTLWTKFVIDTWGSSTFVKKQFCFGLHQTFPLLKSLEIRNVFEGNYNRVYYCIL